MTTEQRVIYMDCAATTQVAPEVLAAMQPVLSEAWGNASSAHGFGQRARRLVEEARVRVAALIGAQPGEIVFTSGATESNNLVIKGALEAHQARGQHAITTTIEHSCVLEAARYMEKRGWTVTYARVDGQALLDPEEIKKALGTKTVLVSVMLANNEVGTIQPVADITRLAREQGAAMHTDATQAVGRIPVDVKALGVDYLSLSGHKFFGPKGAGALYVRRGAKLTPLLHGGDQEGSKRSGTLNVPGIVGLGAAADLAKREMDQRAERTRSLRDRLERGMFERIPYCHLNGHAVLRLPGHVNVSVDFVEGESMMMSLDLQGVACSTGSACSSGSIDPSHVLLAMGCDLARAQSSLRFSLGFYNSEREVDDVLDILPRVVQRLRKMSPTYADFMKQQPQERSHAGV